MEEGNKAAVFVLSTMLEGGCARGVGCVPHPRLRSDERLGLGLKRLTAQ